MPFPLSTNVTPLGSVPVLVNAGVGDPVVVTVKLPAVPTANVVVFALVIAGRWLTFSVSVKLCVADCTHRIVGRTAQRVTSAGACSRSTTQCRRAVPVVHERHTTWQCPCPGQCGCRRSCRRYGEASRRAHRKRGGVRAGNGGRGLNLARRPCQESEDHVVAVRPGGKCRGLRSRRSQLVFDQLPGVPNEVMSKRFVRHVVGIRIIPYHVPTAARTPRIYSQAGSNDQIAGIRSGQPADCGHASSGRDGAVTRRAIKRECARVRVLRTLERSKNNGTAGFQCHSRRRAQG